MAVFVISNLEAKNFTFENIRFERLANSDTLIKKCWHDEHNATFTALADDNLDVKPIINTYGLLGVVDDICLLLSLAQSRCIYCPEYEIKGTSTLRTPFLVGKPTGHKLVWENKIEPYLSTAAQTLRKPRWPKKTGFVPSVYYLLGGNYPELVEVEFMLAWIALEILANAYGNEHGVSTILPSNKFRRVVRPVVSRALSEVDEENLSNEQKEIVLKKVPELNRTSVRDKVCKARDAYGWDFITDELLDDYIQVRNHIMHSGTYGRVERDRVGHLSVRLTASVQLALIYLLGCKGYLGDPLGLKVWITGSQ